jgi:predicted dehydrogenase
MLPPPLRQVNVGILGCGNISDQYFSGCARHPILKIVGCADLDAGRAKVKAQQWDIDAMPVRALLRHHAIDLIINLTFPAAHAKANGACLRAGKHVYCEKPFALDTASCNRVLRLATERALLVGCAPDTVLGGGIQTARHLIDTGKIGTPVAAHAFLQSHGMESWHPNPTFFYKKGGGPMLDMGPYYVTALVTLLGPVAAVSGMVKTSFPERVVSSSPLAGTRIAVEVPTHYSGTLQFEQGAIANVVTSFDVWPGPPLPRIVIYGSTGTIEVPDPNTFKGPVRLFQNGSRDSVEFPLTHTPELSRGTGVADLAHSIRSPGRPVRCSGELAAHVVEVMTAFVRSSDFLRHVPIRSRPPRPAPMPLSATDSGATIGDLGALFDTHQPSPHPA